MELAYVAGLFDGEGTVRIDELLIPAGPDRPKAYRRQQLKVAIGMSHYPTVRALYDQFGGSISRNDYARKKSEKNAICYTWGHSSGGAADFLAAICPYLLTKKEQAAIAIRFQKHIRQCDPIFRKHKGVPPNLEKIRAFRAKLIAELQHHKFGRFDVPKEKLKGPSRKWPYAGFNEA